MIIKNQIFLLIICFNRMNFALLLIEIERYLKFMEYPQTKLDVNRCYLSYFPYILLHLVLLNI